MTVIRQKTTNQNSKGIIGAIILLFVMLRFTICYAQSPVTYNLSELYDFNTKTVYGLYQAKNRHMWIATDHGLFEFDGTVFHQYIHSEYQSEYSWIKEDKQGRIWCRNFAGQIFYIENNTLKLFKDVSEYVGNGLPEFVVARFPEIYIGTDYGYVIADFQSGDTTHFQTSNYDKNRYKILSKRE